MFVNPLKCNFQKNGQFTHRRIMSKELIETNVKTGTKNGAKEWTSNESWALIEEVYENKLRHQ